MPQKAQATVDNLVVWREQLSTRELAQLDDLWFRGLPLADKLVQTAMEDGCLDEEEAAGFIDKDDTYGDIRNKIAERLMAHGIDVEGWWYDHDFAS